MFSVLFQVEKADFEQDLDFKEDFEGQDQGIGQQEHQIQEENTKKSQKRSRRVQKSGFLRWSQVKIEDLKTFQGLSSQNKCTNSF